MISSESDIWKGRREQPPLQRPPAAPQINLSAISLQSGGKTVARYMAQASEEQTHIIFVTKNAAKPNYFSIFAEGSYEKSVIYWK